MENMVITTDFWRGKRVFLTGHTGFKGAWLSLWLTSLGAEATGYSLPPPTEPALFNLCGLKESVADIRGDVRDRAFLENEMLRARPEVVIHMAAQPLVRDSYKMPLETFSINVMGTVNLLEAVRQCPSVRAVINVTTDKCYENREWTWGYREIEPLGGYDPYSNSKACSELITSSYRSSFFNPKEYEAHGVALATARAGNVIGGGDWAADRLIPDCVRSILKGEKIIIRSPQSIRPWQHVLEPLSGYLILAQRLYEDGPRFGEAWNFGPDDKDAGTVEWLVGRMCEKWGDDASYSIERGPHPHEANYLKLDCSKAKTELGWRPRWGLDKAIQSIVEWMRAYQENTNIRNVCLDQIKEYAS